VTTIADPARLTFGTGTVITRREWHDGRMVWAGPVRVVSDDDRGLALWLVGGTTCMRALTVDGRGDHDCSLDEIANLRLAEELWYGAGSFSVTPTDAPYSVWFSFDPDSGDFSGWYVNLEDPLRRWSGGVDTSDHTLDIVVKPDGSWRYKDEDDFVERIGRPGFFDAAGAARIRAAGEAAISLIEADAYPFDGSWTDFRPDPTWTVPDLPKNWDQPRA